MVPRIIGGGPVVVGRAAPVFLPCDPRRIPARVNVSARLQVSVTGVPQGRAAEAQAIIRRLLEPWTGDDPLAIVAHRLSTGEWSLIAYDGAELVRVKDGLADRVLRALRQISDAEAQL